MQLRIAAPSHHDLLLLEQQLRRLIVRDERFGSDEQVDLAAFEQAQTVRVGRGKVEPKFGASSASRADQRNQQETAMI